MAHTLVKQVQKRVSTDDIIFHEGDSGDSMYIIRQGRIEIRKKMGKKELVLDTLKEGDFFGEMCLFGEACRSATAVALENSLLIVIRKNMLEQQLTRVPDWFLVMFKALIKRLRKTDTLLQQHVEDKNDDDFDVFSKS